MSSFRSARVPVPSDFTSASFLGGQGVFLPIGIAALPDESIDVDTNGAWGYKNVAGIVSISTGDRLKSSGRHSSRRRRDRRWRCRTVVRAAGPIWARKRWPECAGSPRARRHRTSVCRLTDL
jgi:hypothetical protein